MKAFIAYRHTGEKHESIRALIQAVEQGLEQAGIAPLSINAAEQPGLREVDFMKQSFAALEGADLLLAIQTSQQKSEGMLMEVGYCIAKSIPVLVAVQADVRDTYLPDMGTASFRWQTLDDLRTQIAAYQFSAL